MRAVSKKRAADGPRRARVREAVFLRDGDCLMRPYRQCHGPLTPHHLQKSSGGGSYTEDNLITLCAGCNSWVEDDPEVAWAMGLTVRGWDTHEAAAERRRKAGIVPGLRRWDERPYMEGEPF